MTLGVIDVHELVAHPGSSRDEAINGTLEGLGTELARVPDDEPLDGDLLLESIVEGILVSGRVEGTFACRCARCLKDFVRPFTVELHELFVPAPDPDADDYALGPEGLIDAEQMVRDAVGVELPFSPVCRPDCKGLCPECGGDRNLGECPGHESTDPRWEALTELLPDLPDDRTHN